MNAQARRGFTVLEMLVVVSIIGILSAITLGGLSRMRPRADVSTATHSFVSAIADARARALATQGDVWLIVYRSGAAAPALHGGWVVYEDSGSNFDFRNYTISGTATPAGAGDVIGDQRWLNASSDGTPVPGSTAVRIGLGALPAFPLDAPFDGASAADCSFCTLATDGLRGALVFQPDGQMRIYDGEGNAVSAGRAVLTLSSEREAVRARAAVAVSVAGLARVTRP